MNDIITTRKLASRHWLAEATDSRGELITKAGKTKAEALTLLAEALSSPEKATRYERYRHELAKLQNMVGKTDFSEAADAEFHEQYKRVKTAYYAACEDVE